MRLLRSTASLVVIALVALAGYALWQGTGPLPDPEKCTADVGGHIVGIDLGQGQNASLIAAVGVRRGLPARAVSIALATAFQESKLRNLPGGDRDSVGIFQQRPSQGWGTVAQIRDPYFATNAFYDALQKIHGYETMRITEAAQKVQRSGFPEAYEDHAPDGRALASALTGFSPGGRFTCVVHDQSARGNARTVLATLTRAYGDLGASQGARQDVVVPVSDNRLGWSVAQWMVAHASTLHIRSVAFDGKQWRMGRDSEQGWTRSSAKKSQVLVTLG